MRLLTVLLLSLVTPPAAAGNAEETTNATLGHGLLAPMQRDAYGPDLHRDATGRPFTFQGHAGDRVDGAVQLDAYGPGTHMDSYGRPVRAHPAW